jgi:hypothetical protein
MATARLDERRKQEMAERYRAGESSTSLAQTYGCSPNTVTRTVRAVLGDEAFEELKQQRGRPVAVTLAALAHDPEPEPDPPSVPDPVEEDQEEDQEEDNQEDENQDDDQEEEDDDDLEAALQADLEAAADFPVLPLLGQPAVAGERTVSRPLPLAQLPGSLYLLVDKEVELRGTRLSDLSELSPLAPEEEQHQAMVMFANPRNAKRQAGRSQRVIKLPDPSLLERTAPYIRAQGITRVVLEGVLYALPGG